MSVETANHSRRRFLYTGALYGLAVWTCYGVAEYLLCSMVPFLSKSFLMFSSVFWQWTGVILAVYALAGWVLGGLSGLAVAALAPRLGMSRQADPSRILRSAATLTLVTVYAANLAVRAPLSGFEYLAGVLAVMLAGALVAEIKSHPWRDWLGGMQNPSAAIILLLAIPWIGCSFLKGDSLALRAGGAVAVAVVVAAGGLLATRVIWRPVPAKDRSVLPAGSCVKAVAGGIVLLLGGGMIFNRTLHVTAAKTHPPRPMDRPNVILITMDTVRADHTSLHGYERDTTPNLKKLAGEATVYTKAIAISDMTLPSHGSMFTGMYPRRHGAHYAPPKNPLGGPLAKDVPTLAEILSANGYSTMAAVANFAYLSPEWGLARGFHVFDRCASPVLLEPGQRYYLRNVVRDSLGVFVSTAEFDRTTKRAEAINSDALKLLDRATNGQGFFLFVNYMDAHMPYVPPPPFDHLFASDGGELRQAEAAAVREGVLRAKRRITSGEHRRLVALYDGGIAYIDFAIGELIAELRRRDLYDNTMIVITSDHGEAFGERDLMGHGGISVYQDQTYVPLLVKYPDRGQGVVSNAPVSHIDFLPTILDVVGLAAPAGVHGKSLLEVREDDPRALVAVSYPDSFLISLGRRFNRTEHAVLCGDLKLITSSSGKRELYNLSDDPNERRNLYRRDDPITLRLMSKLAEWLRTIRPPRRPGSLEPDEESLERLKSLGYLQ